MKRLKAWAFLSLSVALLTGETAHASTFVEVTMTCPVGGRPFQYFQHASYSTFGQMPDGMPIGSTEFPIVPPVCPDNGLVMFREFTPEEVARLEAFLATPDFVSMRGSETPLFIASRISSFLGDKDNPWLLLAASWEAKRLPVDVARVARYQQAFIAVAMSSDLAPGIERTILMMRATNALRETSQFQEAERMRLETVAMLAQLPQPTVDSGQDNSETRDDLNQFLGALGAVIARGDTTRSPIDISDATSAARQCLDLGYRTNPDALLDYQRAACQSEYVAEAIDEIS